jgi:tRNA(Arg) A34 adenosine deaminase TadA
VAAKKAVGREVSDLSCPAIGAMALPPSVRGSITLMILEPPMPSPVDPDLVLLRQAIALAEDAVRAGNHPFGAVARLADGRIVTALNTVGSDRDATRHAEMNLIHDCARAGLSLVGATMYASTEPCVMCAGGLYWAGVTRLVYGCSTVRLAAYAGGSLAVPCRTVLREGRRPIEICGPLLEAEAEAPHAGFWKH